MSIRFTCGNAQCGKIVNAPDALAGKSARCPHCKQVQQVPAAQPAGANTDPAAQSGDTQTVIAQQPSAPRKPIALTDTAATNAVRPKARCSECGIGYPASSPKCPMCGKPTASQPPAPQAPPAPANRQAAPKAPTGAPTPAAPKAPPAPKASPAPKAPPAKSGPAAPTGPASAPVKPAPKPGPGGIRNARSQALQAKPADRTCPDCGSASPATAISCSLCGRRLTVASAPVLIPMGPATPAPKRKRAAADEGVIPLADDDGLIPFADDDSLVALQDGPPLPDASAGKVPPLPMARPPQFQPRAAVLPSLADLPREAFSSVAYGLRNIRALVTLVCIGLAAEFVVRIIFWRFHIFGPFFQAMCSLVVWGIYLLFFRDVIIATTESQEDTPQMPDMDPIGVARSVAHGIGLVMVYIVPVVTLPLMPLGFLAYGFVGDKRAFDLWWAMKSAFRAFGSLIVVWASILLWVLVLGGAVVLIDVGKFLFIPFSFANLMPLLGLALVSKLIAVVLGYSVFRSCAMLGRYHPQLLESLPDDDKDWLGTVVYAAGILVFMCLCAFAVWTVIQGVQVSIDAMEKANQLPDIPMPVLDLQRDMPMEMPGE